MARRLGGFSFRDAQRIGRVVRRVEGMEEGGGFDNEPDSPLQFGPIYVEIREHDGKKYGWKALYVVDDEWQTSEDQKATYSDAWHAREKWESVVVPLGARVWLYPTGADWWTFTFDESCVASCEEDIDGGSTGTVKLTDYDNIEVQAENTLDTVPAGNMIVHHIHGRFVIGVAGCVEEEA